MLTIWKDILKLYSEYVGTGMIVALFFMSLLYLWLKEKEISKKVILVFTPVLLFIVFFVPLFAAFIYRYLDAEVYYRYLWLIPFIIVIAYAGVRFILKMQGVKRLIAVLAVGAIVIVCGDYVYDNEYYSKADNLYHVPQVVVDICDEIIVEGREVKAIFPQELLQYVRQYTPYVCMPYGREMVVERWDSYNPVYDAYELNTNAANLAQVARNNGCQYIIWDVTREMDGTLTDFEYILISTKEKYAIYQDSQAYLGL